MGKTASKRIRRASAATAPQPHFEATPERRAHAANDSSIVPATIGKAGERALLTRRFTDSPIDRMHKVGRLTYAQWFAACWYLEQFALSGIAGRVVANYGEGSGGGGPSVGTKILGSERQYIARLRWRAARATIPANMLKLVDSVVLEQVVPAFANGRMRDRFAASIGAALQPMAVSINAPAAVDEVSVSA